MRLTVFIVLFVCLSISGFGDDDPVVITAPTPCYNGMAKVKPIKIVRTVEEIDNPELSAFAGILSIAVDKGGNYYVFDYRHGAIVKLNRDFKFIKTIGGKGEGPGEFKPLNMQTPSFLSIGLDNNLYFSSVMNRKIIAYSLDGKYINEYEVEHFRPFQALVDEKGLFYLPSLKRDDVIGVYSREMKFQRSLVSSEIRNTYLFQKPPACVIFNRVIPDYFSLKYAFTSNRDLLLVNNTSLAIVVADRKTGKIKKQFYAWDNYIIEQFKKKIETVLERGKKLKACSYSYAFTSFFIDDRDYIYLTFAGNQRDYFLYQFSLAGELIQVYEAEKPPDNSLPTFFRAEDNKFFANTRYGIFIYKPQD